MHKKLRYSRVAMILHWLIAIALIALIPMGWWMRDALENPEQQALAYRIYQIHKSLGFTVLALTILRLVWRLTHKPPEMPGGMRGWEVFFARATHAALYMVMLLVPLSGWIYVSAGWATLTDQPLNVATSWFGLFGIPHLSFIADAAAELRRALAFTSIQFHEALAINSIALIVLHIVGALKHQFIDRDAVMPSMVPWLRMPASEEREAAPRGRGYLAGAVGALAIIASAAIPAWGEWQETRGAALPETAETPTASATIETEVLPGTASQWAVDQAQSSLTFSGEHAGAPFEGRFEEWQGHIWFDPEDLAGSKIVMLIEPGSARTGDATQEATLTDPEWFDVEAYPLARFDSSEIRALGGDEYEVSGVLRVKSGSLPVTFPATITIDGETGMATGSFTLDRTELDMGMKSDPSGQWVSLEIPLDFHIAATREP